jgi:hypothetical protein
VDGDDRLQPDFLSSMESALRAEATASFAFGDWQCFGSTNDLWSFPDPLPPPCPQHLVIPGSGTVMHRHVWADIGGYLENREAAGIEDWDFWISAAERGLHGVHVPRPLYLHRRHPGAMSVTASLANDHIVRELLYRRHRRTFETFGDCPRCPDEKRVEAFLAEGYVTGSSVALARGMRIQAARLAIRGFSSLPGRRTAAQMMRALLPGPVVAIGRSVRRRLRNVNAFRPA